MPNTVGPPADRIPRQSVDDLPMRHVDPDPLPGSSAPGTTAFLAAVGVVVARHTGSRRVGLDLLAGGAPPDDIVRVTCEVERNSTADDVVREVASDPELVRVARQAERVAITVPPDDNSTAGQAFASLRISVEAGHLAVEYAPDVQTADTAARFAEHVRLVLTSGTGSTDPVWDIPLDRATPREASPPGGAVLSPAEFLERWVGGHRVPTGRVAAALRATGAAPDRVGLLAEHSDVAITGLLAVLGAGSICVLLDPLDPPARLSRVITHSGVDALLVPVHRVDLAERVAGDIPVLPFDPSATGDADRLRLPFLRPEAPAVTRYVTGSLIKPLSLSLSWESVVLQGSRYARTVGIVADDVLVDLVPHTARAGLVGALGAVAGGATVHFLDPLAEAGSLLESVRRCLPTVIQATASTLRAAVEAVRPADRELPTVRAVVLVGEPVTADDLAVIRTAVPGRTVFHGHVIPEAGLVLLHEVSAADNRAEVVPWGRPVAGVQVELRSGDRPAGEPLGALVVTTSGQAVEHPGPVRTGDVVRRHPGGELTAAGRVDRRFTSAGHHVDPDEVAALLRAHPSIGQAVVAGVADGTPTHRAFVRPVVDDAIDEQGVRHFLTRLLPSWAVPGDVVVVDEFPVDDRGAVDLAVLLRAEPATRQEELALTESQRVISEVWSDVLRRDDLTLDAHFVRLGGDSLQLVRMIALVNDRLNFRLSLVDVMNQPTIRAISAIVDG